MAGRENFDMVIVGLEPLKKKLSRLEKELLSVELFQEIGSLLQFNILDRTAMGVDVDGRPFQAYSKGYEAYRRREGLPTEPDLFDTGSMLSSLTYEATSEYARVYFLPSEDKEGTSNPAKAYYNQELRQFFGISAEDAVEINTLIDDFLEDALRR
jgi:hypothetical protein